MFKTYKEQCDFEIWAFGRPEVYYSKHLTHCWNRLHGEKYMIQRDADINDHLDKIYDIYRATVKV